MTACTVNLPDQGQTCGKALLPDMVWPWALRLSSKSVTGAAVVQKFSSRFITMPVIASTLALTLVSPRASCQRRHQV